MTVYEAIKKAEAKIIIETALVFCSRSPRAINAYDCAVCPFHYNCQTIEKAKKAYRKLNDVIEEESVEE